MAYDVGDSLVNTPTDKDNRRRAIAAQVLCNLAKSDPNGKMRNTFPALLAVTQDKRFVTARHFMQSLWKTGASNKQLQQQLIDGLAVRCTECAPTTKASACQPKPGSPPNQTGNTAKHTRPFGQNAKASPASKTPPYPSPPSFPCPVSS